MKTPHHLTWLLLALLLAALSTDATVPVPSSTTAAAITAASPACTTLPGPPHRAGEAALECVLAGNPPPPGATQAAGCLEVPWDEPGAGSLNWPAQCGVAEVLAERLSPTWLHPFLGRGPEPLAWSPLAAWEENSTIYLPRIIVSVLAYHQRVDDPKSREIAARWLRAMWTTLALQSVPERPARWQVCSGDECHARSDSAHNYEKQRGVTVVAAGDRIIQHIGARTHVERAMTSTLLGWALDLRPRWTGKRPGQDWMAWEARIVERLMGASIGDHTRARAWGLTPAERDILRTLVARPTDLRLVRTALEWLKPWSRRRGSPLTIIRYANGAVASLRASPGGAGRAMNSNKPSCEAVVTTHGPNGYVSRWTCAADYAPVGATRAFLRLDPDLRHAMSYADGRTLRVRLPNPRHVAYALVWHLTLDLRPGPAASNDGVPPPEPADPEPEPAPTARLCAGDDATAVRACMAARLRELARSLGGRSR
ncbi:MAG: hypothetical protein AAF772_10740 [Acidobacteriota bacterium]